MTTVDDQEPPLPERSLAVVESFLDGEPVDLQELKEALARPDAREHLIDVLALRRDVWASGPHHWSAAHAGQRSGRKGVSWIAAAAGLAISLATGYAVGHQARASQLDAGVEVVLDAATPVPPQPTQVITLTPGVNWTETDVRRKPHAISGDR
jgi:hypothetical protein